MPREAVIAARVRAPFTFARKSPLAQVRPDELGGGMVLEAV